MNQTDTMHGRDRWNPAALLSPRGFYLSGPEADRHGDERARLAGVGARAEGLPRGRRAANHGRGRGPSGWYNRVYAYFPL